jgi:glycosyltransferase involved in cell wall biosynthesis
VKILHCIPGMGGGGAEKQLTYLAAELVRNGCIVDVALVNAGPNFERLATSGATIHRIRSRGNHDPRIWLQLRQLMRRVRPDLVHTWLTQMDILGGYAARRARLPWVMSERSAVEAYPRSAKNRLRELLASKASAIVSNSLGGDAYWAAIVGDAVPRFVVPNALPLSEIQAALPIVRSEQGIASDERIILSAGRFSGEKNTLNILEAVALLNDPRVKCVLAGTGPLLPALLRRAEELQLTKQVRFLDYNGNLWGWMKMADVVVSVSSFEGSPNVVMEAMACGAPVVLSDIPAHRVLFNADGATFADGNDPGAIATALRATLAEPAAARHRAEQARKRAAAFDVDNVVPAVFGVYRHVLTASCIPQVM